MLPSALLPLLLMHIRVRKLLSGLLSGLLSFIAFLQRAYYIG